MKTSYDIKQRVELGRWRGVEGGGEGMCFPLPPILLPLVHIPSELLSYSYVWYVLFFCAFPQKRKDRQAENIWKAVFPPG